MKVKWTGWEMESERTERKTSISIWLTMCSQKIRQKKKKGTSLDEWDQIKK